MISADPKHPLVKFGPFGRRGTGDRCWKLMGDVLVVWEDFAFVVPDGFIFDMGSVPRAFWWLVPPTGPGNLGFLCHDFCYRESEQSPKDAAGADMSREQADEMMYDLLVYGGLPKWRAWIAWRGVRRGGWLSYKRKNRIFNGAKNRRHDDA